MNPWAEAWHKLSEEDRSVLLELGFNEGGLVEDEILRAFVSLARRTHEKET